MSPDPVITTLADELHRRLGTQLRGLWLYGSRARGDARPTSDYDVLIIVDEKTQVMRDRILDLQVEILDRYEALVATLLRTESEWFGSQDSPLARNIAREAVRL
ncbi:nucleotidyltransferase family protein [uncultured Thiodictyon sp.]|nr:nucleotidyltransferase domain-containing protein [uncultured Thiodictyon sp.]